MEEEQKSFRFAIGAFALAFVICVIVVSESKRMRAETKAETDIITACLSSGKNFHRAWLSQRIFCR
jgi:hypothetical protein